MRNFPREIPRGGNKIPDSPVGCEFNWRESRGSGRQNCEQTRGR